MKISSPGLCKAVRQLCFHRGSIDSGWAKGTSVRSVFNSRGLCSHVVNGTRCKHPGRYHRVGNCCNDWRQCLAIRAGGLWLCEIGASLSLSLSLALYVTGRPHMEPDGPRSRKRLKGVSQWRRACVARAGRVRGRTREHAASSRQESRMTTRTPDICHDF